MRNVAVVSGGIVGITAALLAAERGARVTLYEARDELWQCASAMNEGKVHLGPIFALGDRITHDVMLRGATTFAAVLERAYAAALPWEELSTVPFRYLVMPDSLVTADQLAARYRSLNEQLGRHRAPTYLGRPLGRLVDPVARTDEATGLPAFDTEERAVDPLRLGALLVDRVRNHPLVTVRTGCAVERVDDGQVCWGDEQERYDVVIACTWDQQELLVPEEHRVRRNFRVKCALRLPRVGDDRTTVTLVQGPFGDVVTHRDYVYASWYPEARLTNEFAIAPSPRAHHLRDGAASRPELVTEQIKPLQSLGLLRDLTIHTDEVEVVAGFIAGHGPLDISERESGLHRRAEFGTEVHGSLVVARNFKLTTAPLAALAAVDVALGS